MDAPAIEVSGLTKSFGPLRALDGVTFDVPRGSVFGFLGPNGSGKTTTLGVLTGLIAADSGRARIAGREVRAGSVDALDAVGALVEEPAFYPFLSGRRNLEIVARLVGAPRSRVDETLARVGLSHAADQAYKGYSQGMRRRLGLGAALVPDPDVVILDEPTNGLDPAGQLEVRKLLQELAAAGRTVLLSSHILHEVQGSCTHVAVLRKGRVVAQGKMADLLRGASRLVVGVDFPQKALDVARLVAGVASAEVKDGRLLVEAPPEAASEVNRALVSAGLRVFHLAREDAGLEARFLEWTGDAS